jgi:5'-phosphate synthase pdxT subunit
MNIGILALQGSFREHAESLSRLEVEPVLVRLPEQLEGLHGLIIPGGESTTIGKLLRDYGFQQKLKDLGCAGFPIYGTCAGLILLARKISGGDQSVLGLMDIRVRRNAFGRQLDSFETDLFIPAIGRKPFRAIFIRAPWIDRVGAGVRVLTKLGDGAIVAAEQGNLLVSAFHPELTDDPRFHRYFLKKVELFRGRASRLAVSF